MDHLHVTNRRTILGIGLSLVLLIAVTVPALAGAVPKPRAAAGVSMPRGLEADLSMPRDPGALATQDTSLQPPDPAAGRQSYAENCAPCHGKAGKGDGQAASGLSVPPTAFADSIAIAGLSLADWFDIVKNGRMDRMMPPWSQRLTDQQIWDTVGYAWSLHTSQAQVEMGKAVYDTNCASCHGPNGKGKSPLPDFTDFAVTSKMSQSQWAEVVKSGRNGMPAFGARLSEAEQVAALEYIRSLSMGPMFSAALALPGPEGTGQPGTGVISGTVTNGTTGRTVPDLRVDIAIFDGSNLLDQRSAETDQTGTYRFEKLSTDPNLVYVTRAEYPAGTPNNSDVISFQAGQDAIDLPIAVYETTDDASGIRAERVHYIVEFADGRAQVAELIVFSLDGNRTYTGDGTGMLRFNLPPGAQDLSISDGELGARYLATENGFVDTLPLPPGQATRQVLYRYTLPYAGNELDLERSLPYPATNVNALVADVGQKVTSEALSNQGVRQTQNGNYYNLLAQNLPANQPIVVHLVGLPSVAGGAEPSSGNPLAGRILLYAVVTLAAACAILLALWPVLRRRAQTSAVVEETADREGLIDALARLDNAYEAGHIPEMAYRDQRLRLKARLLDLMRKEQG